MAPWTNIISVTWELVININSQTPPETTESRSLGLGPRNLCFKKLLFVILLNVEVHQILLLSLAITLCLNFNHPTLHVATAFCLPSSPDQLSQPLKSFSPAETTIYCFCHFSLVLSPLMSLLSPFSATHVTTLCSLSYTTSK